MFSGNGCSPGQDNKTMLVRAGSAQTKFVWNVAAGHDAEHGAYERETWWFRADSDRTTLRFISLDQRPSNCGHVIGALSLVPG